MLPFFSSASFLFALHRKIHSFSIPFIYIPCLTRSLNVRSFFSECLSRILEYYGLCIFRFMSHFAQRLRNYNRLFSFLFSCWCQQSYVYKLSVVVLMNNISSHYLWRFLTLSLLCSLPKTNEIIKSETLQSLKSNMSALMACVRV